MFDDVFLNGFVKTALVPIQDLSWLDIDEEEYHNYERLPDYKKFLNCKDQLKELWDHKPAFRGPTEFTLTPAHAKEALPDADKKHKASVNEEDVQDLLKRVRFAVAEGKIGSELVEFIHQNFDTTTIDASVTGLKKIAQEYGLLGFAYVDPVLYDCQKSKESNLRKDFPEVSLKREKCASCKYNSNNTCLKFELPLVENLSFDTVLINKLSHKLQSFGFDFVDDISLKPSERIRKIFLSKHHSKSSTLTSFPKHDVTQIDIGQKEIDQFTQESTKEAQEKLSALNTPESCQIVQDIVGFLKNCFEQKIYSKEAVQALESKFTVHDLKLAEQPIRELFRKQNKKNQLKDLLHEQKIPSSGAQEATVHSLNVSSKLSEADRLKSVSIVAKIKQALQEGIELELIRTKIASLVPEFLVPILLKQALLEVSGKDEKSFEQFKNLEAQDYKFSKSDLIVVKIKQALSKGVKIESIKTKIATLVPGSLVSPLLKKAFLEVSSIDTKSFEYCKKLGTQGYKVNKDATIQGKSDCSGCLFNCKVYCTKLGRKFLGKDFNSKASGEIDKTAEEIKQFFNGSKIAIEMSPKTELFQGEIEDLNEFTIP